MIHTKITNVLIVLLILSLWASLYIHMKFEIDMNNFNLQKQISVLKQNIQENTKTYNSSTIIPNIEKDNIDEPEIDDNIYMEVPGIPN